MGGVKLLLGAVVELVMLAGCTEGACSGLGGRPALTGASAAEESAEDVAVSLDAAASAGALATAGARLMSL